jgi:hypothetical protein
MSVASPTIELISETMAVAANEIAWVAVEQAGGHEGGGR